MNSRLSTASVFYAIILGNSGNMMLPFKIGEATKIMLLGKEENSSYGSASINLFMERIIDVIILISLSVVTAFFVGFDTSIMEKITLMRNIMITGIIISLLFFLLFKHRAKELTEKFTILDRAIKLIGNNEIIKNPIIFIKTMAYIGVSWLCVYFSTIFGVYAVGIFNIKMVLISSLTVLVMTNLAMLIPSAPGGIGVFQFACIYSLSLFSYSGIEKAILAILLHLIQYMALIPMAIYILIVKRYHLILFKKNDSTRGDLVG